MTPVIHIRWGKSIRRSPMSLFELFTIERSRLEGGLFCCYKDLPPFIEVSSHTQEENVSGVGLGRMYS